MLKSTTQQASFDQRLNPGVADGFVIHARQAPKRHRFKYQMSWCLLDLDQLEKVMRSNRWWRHNGFSWFSLYDKDYINNQPTSIKQKIIDHLDQHQGVSFSGQVFLFTHPRFLGYGFNSVNFYFCYQQHRLSYVVAEITNTPWGEKHLYTFDCESAKVTDRGLSFAFDKAFHISPFVSMNIGYEWYFDVTPEHIKVNMQLYENKVNVMKVHLDTKITPFVENNKHKVLMQRPFQPWKMAIGIYWQAIKLWVKKVPFYPHPKTTD